MVKFFSQSHKYDDPWQTVTLAFFLRYPNPYASHVLACDVISRTPTESGTLLTTRLILKKGAVPKWFPQKFVNRAESWVVEESEVDVEGKVVRCRTRNLDHVKVMQVREEVELREAEDGTTIQKTTASIVSNFGWGLTKRIEKYGVNKLKSNLERSREGISLVLSLLRESRSRLGATPLPLGMIAGSGLGNPSTSGTLFDPSLYNTHRSAQWDVSAASELRSRDDDAPAPKEFASASSDDSSTDSTGTRLSWVMAWIPWRRPPTAGPSEDS